MKNGRLVYSACSTDFVLLVTGISKCQLTPDERERERMRGGRKGRREAEKETWKRKERNSDRQNSHRKRESG